MQRADILSGYPDGTFKPQGSLRRSELATLLNKFSDIPGLEASGKPA